MTRGAAQPRILIADDSELILELIGAMLERSGFTCLSSAHSGRETLAKAQEFQPDLILLDIGLPDLDGYEVTRRLRAMHWSKRLAIIIQTGKENPDESDLATKAGADDIIFKPINRGKLLAAIERQLEAQPGDATATAASDRVS